MKATYKHPIKDYPSLGRDKAKKLGIQRALDKAKQSNLASTPRKHK